MKFFRYVTDSDSTLIVCEACRNLGVVDDINYDQPDESLVYSLLSEAFYPGITCGCCGYVEEKSQN
jgi:hypothetical protein